MYKRKKYEERRDLLDSRTYRTGFIGEFSDREMEEDFNNGDGRLGYQIRRLILIFAILYFSLIMFDYFYYEETSLFINSLVARSLILLYAVVSFRLLPSMKKANSMYLCLSVFEIFLILSYQWILHQGGAAGDFSEQALAFMLTIICFFLAPNRWIYSVLVSVFTLLSFWIIYQLLSQEVQWFDAIEVGIYLLLAVFTCAFWDHSSRYYKREQYAKEQMLKKMMMTDQLTGANNRIKFDEELQKCCDKDRSEFEGYAVAMFDLDHFKAVNDKFGHMAGDAVLKEFVARVYENIRIEDIFARWGGEEFVIIIVDAKEEEALRFVQRIRKVIAETRFGDVGNVTVSAGVTILQQDDDPDSIMRRVDNYLYLAKETGRNKVIHDMSVELEENNLPLCK